MASEGTVAGQDPAGAKDGRSTTPRPEDYAKNVEQTYRGMVEQVRSVQSRTAARMTWFVGIAGYVVFATPTFAAAIWPTLPRQHYVALMIAPFTAAAFAALWSLLVLTEEMDKGERWWLELTARIQPIYLMNEAAASKSVDALLEHLATEVVPPSTASGAVRLATWALVAAFAVSTLAAVAWTLSPP